jgi:hypothetical protein
MNRLIKVLMAGALLAAGCTDTNGPSEAASTAGKADETTSLIANNGGFYTVTLDGKPKRSVRFNSNNSCTFTVSELTFTGSDSFPNETLTSSLTGFSIDTTDVTYTFATTAHVTKATFKLLSATGTCPVALFAADEPSTVSTRPTGGQPEAFGYTPLGTQVVTGSNSGITNLAHLLVFQGKAIANRILLDRSDAASCQPEYVKVVLPGGRDAAIVFTPPNIFDLDISLPPQSIDYVLVKSRPFTGVQCSYAVKTINTHLVNAPTKP